MSRNSEKQYGLILPKKKNPIPETGLRRLNPLRDSDDELEKDETEESINWVQESLKHAAGNAGQKNLQKRLIREAVAEDATVFQYDEIYDAIKSTKLSKAQNKSVDKKPKYIGTIMKHAQKRKLEQERRTERKIQLEREAEGDQFVDKESFVTPSYLKKLEELKKADEEDRQERLREEVLDVHKHKNFGMFYNHILNQRVGETKVKEEPVEEDPAAVSPTEEAVIQEDRNAHFTERKQASVKERRKHYRTHFDLSESPPRQEISVSRNKRQSGRSSTSSDSDEDTGTLVKGRKKKAQDKDTDSKSKEAVVEQKKTNQESSDNSQQRKDSVSVVSRQLSPEEIKKKRNEMIRKLFAKRTVGEHLEAALQRYYERKANIQTREV